MGYYVTLEESEFVVPETPEVLQVIKDANTKYDSLKRGGSFSNGQYTSRWFSWLDADYDKKITSVQEFFEMLGFECSNNGTGVSLDSYSDKTGQEELFLSIVAPFVSQGSYIIWRGEDGATWKYVVEDKKLWNCDGEVVFRKQRPIIFYRSTFGLSNSGPEWVTLEEAEELTKKLALQLEEGKE